MQEANPRGKERLSGKGHIRLREQMETDARYPMRNAIAGYFKLASITNIPGRRTGQGRTIINGYYRKLMDYTGVAEARSWAAM
jgi:hypothetical protein